MSTSIIHRYFFKYTVLAVQTIIIFAFYQSSQCMSPLQFEVLWIWGCVIACFGAIQDIILEGYRINVSKPQISSTQNLLGNQTGFRLAGLFVSSGALGISHYGSWKLASYVIIGAISIAMLLIGVNSPFPRELFTKEQESSSYWASLKKELKDFFSWNRFPLVLLIHLFAYKMIDAFIRWMLPLFLYGQGYSNIELMYADKGLGWGSVLLGGFVAHKALQRIPLKWALLAWGIAQTIADSTCLFQWYLGKHMGLLFFNSFLHQMLSGVGNLLIWVYISDYCRSSHTMMRYSIISAWFTLDRLCVTWCASLVYGRTHFLTFLALGMLFSALSAMTFLYSQKVMNRTL
ncbi:hypothetical protein [Holospora curviuscula]|uniref:hypothetical protein n=1 Tax=Holospora curviuscula TaxID=1082868 RepID=UPI00101ADD23|nr:hypothetical protein [Holospora curviuscula]